MEILAYKTAQEAKKQLEKYELNNREAFEGLVKRQGESASERLGKQTYFFVAELAAYVDNKVPLFSFESEAFPFLGHSGFYKGISSLVQGVKNAVRQQTPKNIEVILYTTEEKNYIKGLTKKEKREIILSYLESLANEEIDELDEMTIRDIKKLDELNKLENERPEMKRGLTKQEVDEFVRLYSEK